MRTYKVTIIRTSPLRAYHTSPPIREKINYSRTRDSGREGNERRLRPRKKKKRERERDREKDASRAKLSALENASSCRCINVITEAPDVSPPLFPFPLPLSFFHHLLAVFRMDPAHFTTRAPDTRPCAIKTKWLQKPHPTRPIHGAGVWTSESRPKWLCDSARIRFLWSENTSASPGSFIEPIIERRCVIARRRLTLDPTQSFR